MPSTIKDIGCGQAFWVSAEQSVDEVYEALRQGGFDGALVEAPSGDPGLIGYYDLRELVLRGGVELSSPVGEYASRCPFHATPAMSAHSALSQMRRCALPLIPVWERGQVVGILTAAAAGKSLRDSLRVRQRASGSQDLLGDPIFRKAGHRRPCNQL